MAEYIKREDAISHPFANEKYDRKNANLDFILGQESYKEWLENLPAADVVEVVRCKDCKHYYNDADVGMACEFTSMAQPEDGFCNWEERKDEDDG